jgi:hypothetical protein
VQFLKSTHTLFGQIIGQSQGASRRVVSRRTPAVFRPLHFDQILEARLLPRETRVDRGKPRALASAGLIDEYRLYYVPIFLGSGKAAFSQIQNSVRLKPVETLTFSSGTVLLRCAPVTP